MKKITLWIILFCVCLGSYNVAREYKAECKTRKEEQAVLTLARAYGAEISSVKEAEFFKRLIELEPKKEFLILVDKNNPLEQNYAPEDMVTLGEYENIKAASGTMRLRAEAAEALSEMQSATKVILRVSSAYRSYKYQIGVYDRKKQRSGEAEAEKFVAKAGHSQHQLGTAVDFNGLTESFAKTAASKWFVKHASVYGFSLSYPKDAREVTGYAFEPWHYRYITPEGTYFQDVFFAGSQQKTLEFLNAYFKETAENQVKN